MMVPPYLVTISFIIAAAICAIDIPKSPSWRSKSIRACQVVVMVIAAFYYGQAAVTAALPSSDLRIVWICMAAVTVAEVVSRWQLGQKKL
jgi:hypothetical protein